MSMGGGGGGTSTTTTKMPAWILPYAQNFLSMVNSQVGSQLGGMNPFMRQGINMMAGQTGAAQSYLDKNAAAVSRMASQNPAMNPYLGQYYSAAALPLEQQFQMSTQPSMMAEAERAGAMDSSGFNAQQGLAQSGLAQGLGTLGAGIYEPAWQQGEQLQQNAQQMLPGIVSSMYGPGQQLFGLGQSQAQYPFALLSELGAAIGQAGGGTGQTISTSPGVGGFK